MAKLVVVYHSGYGHTARVAEAVARGVTMGGGQLTLLKVEDVQGNFDAFVAADGIIFGCPTYMGGPSAPFKAFIDSASKIWLKQGWKDKIAAGFTNSGALSGDKSHTIDALYINAMQHGMIWVGNPILPTGKTENDINRLGSYSGLMTQADNAPPEQTPPPADLKTAEMFGERVAKITEQFLRGRAG